MMMKSSETVLASRDNTRSQPCLRQGGGGAWTLIEYKEEEEKELPT